MAEIKRSDLLFLMLGLLGFTLYLVGAMGDVQFTLRELLLPPGAEAHHPYPEVTFYGLILVAVSVAYFAVVAFVDLVRERRTRRRYF